MTPIFYQKDRSQLMKNGHLEFKCLGSRVAFLLPIQKSFSGAWIPDSKYVPNLESRDFELVFRQFELNDFLYSSGERSAGVKWMLSVKL